jgi:hypothetical protein
METQTFPIIDSNGFVVAVAQAEDANPTSNDPATVTIFDLDGEIVLQIEATCPLEPGADLGLYPTVKFNAVIEFEEGEI